jgi:ParB family chromosome partitioning protein
MKATTSNRTTRPKAKATKSKVKPTKPMEEMVPVNQIKVGKRFRPKKDIYVGDLVTSIRLLTKDGFDGLLQAICVYYDAKRGVYKLVFGFRRLKAFKKLKRAEIRCTVVHTFADALAALRAERDENVCRIEITNTVQEDLDTTIAMLTLARQDAAERKKTTQYKKGGKADTNGVGKFPTPSAESNGRANDKAAEEYSKRTGHKIKGKTYGRMMEVRAGAKADPVRIGPIEKQMDKDRKINPAWKAMKAIQAEDKKREAATNGVPVPVAARITQNPQPPDATDGAEDQGVTDGADAQGEQPQPVKPSPEFKSPSQSRCGVTLDEAALAMKLVIEFQKMEPPPMVPHHRFNGYMAKLKADSIAALQAPSRYRIELINDHDEATSAALSSNLRSLYVIGFGPDETVETLTEAFRNHGHARISGAVELGHGALGRYAVFTVNNSPEIVTRSLHNARLNGYTLRVTLAFPRARQA